MMWCDGNDDYSVVRGSDVLLLNDNRSDEIPRRCPSPTRNISSLCLCLAEPSYSYTRTVLTVCGAVDTEFVRREAYKIFNENAVVVG